MRADVIVFICLASSSTARRRSSKFPDAQVSDDQLDLGRSLWTLNIPSQIARTTRALSRIGSRKPLSSPRADIGTAPPPPHTAKASDLFNELDIDGDGKVTKHELRRAMESSDFISKVLHLNDYRDCSVLIDRADEDSNGTMEFEEFCQYLRNSERIRTIEEAAISRHRKEREVHKSSSWKHLLSRGAIIGLFAMIIAPKLPHLAASYSAFAMASPYMCSVCTSSVKGVISDTFAQFVVEKKKKPDLRRTLAFALFGATYLGAYCQFKYAYLYTILFGATKSASVIGMKMAVDMLISAPFIYFPTYYLFKGGLFGKPLKEMRSYFTREGFIMLKRYWAVWVPTTLVMWTAVPNHLRVPFLCAVSLAWQVLLSTLSYAKTPTKQLVRPVNNPLQWRTEDVSLIVDR